MPFETALCFGLLLAGFGLLAYLSFRRAIRHLRQGRCVDSRTEAKIEYTNSCFFAFVGLMLFLLLSLVLIAATGILVVGDRAADVIQ